MSKKRVMANSPFTKLQDEVGQHPRLRQNILKRLGDRLDATVVSLFASFRSMESDITDDDAEMLESLLAAEHTGGKLVLIINSPGGSGMAAERIVNVCREYSENKFEVVVPHMAKSAATLICFGASQIHMSRTAELGPVDPQVRYPADDGEHRWISAEEYVRSYDALMDKAANSSAKRIEPYLQQLSRYDSREIENMRSAQKLSEDISIRLLKTGMMSKLAPKDIRSAITVFLAQAQKSAHGRMINYDEAKSCGLNMSPIDLRSELWDDVWELYVRSDWIVSRTVKVMESKKSSLQYRAIQ